MSQSPLKAATVVITVDAILDKDGRFLHWHRQFVDLIRGFPGLVEISLVEPIAGVQEQWTQLFSFDSVEKLRALLDAEAYQALLNSAEAEIGMPASQQVVADSRSTTVPVTVVISQLLKPGCEDAYQEWQTRVDRSAGRFPGFIGSELIRPVPGVQAEWVVVFRFDSTEHLDNWFNSKVHDDLMKEAEPFYQDVKVRRIGRGFEDWFANAAGQSSNGPPQWKMAMMVLLALYPTVMLLTLGLAPLTTGMALSYSMFFANVCSVVLLTWLIMPLTTRALRFWIDTAQPVKTSTTILGAILILVLYAAMIAGFAMTSPL